MTNIPEPEFVLKATPPRMPRTSLRRERLLHRWADARQRTVNAIVAPTGFGKTTLLLHWRLLWLEQGALVAWLTVDARDDPVRFRMALLHALRHASGRSRSDALAARHARQVDHQVEGLTSLLAEIAQLGVETVLVIDEAERLPEATVRDALAYLIHNAPPNLRLVFGSRTPLQLDTSGLSANNHVALLGADDLRLRIEESTAILSRRFGQRLDADDCARLHDVTGGWPIGLQLAAATIEHAPDLAEAIDALSARREPIESALVDALLSRLPADVAGFLTRIAILEHMNAELCEAVTGCASTTAYLAQLMLETPILMVGQSKDWNRLHPLARDVLLVRFGQLPIAEQCELHRRAAGWFVEQNRYPEAARHAFAAGDASLAQSHAARSLWMFGTEGRMPEAREWLARIPAKSIANHIDLRLTAAWIMTMSERNLEALESAKALLADPQLEPRAQFVAALVAATAAGYADRLGLIPGLLARWPEGSASIDASGHPVGYANCIFAVALHQGRTERVRELESRSPASTYKDLPVLGRAIGRTLVGLSHLWDGNPERAEAAVRPAMLQAEQATGRRGAVACMFAAVVAAALLERNRPEAAQALLAGRLDVIESTAIPDVILSAYRTLAYVALSRGDEQGALEILDGLRALGETRQMPRLVVHAVAEQIRIHALQSHNETVGKLENALDDFAAVFAEPAFSLFRPQYDLLSAIAKSHAALGRGDPGTAERHLMSADALAAELHRGRDALIVKALRAVVARQRGAVYALRLLGEARSLARIGGNQRLLVDSHPLAVQMGTELRKPVGAAKKTPAVADRLPDVPSKPATASTSCNGLLTPREAKILGLLGNRQPNELIATTMDISDAAVKWHLDHLCAKLSAGTLAQAVDRAKLLGLLGD